VATTIKAKETKVVTTIKAKETKVVTTIKAREKENLQKTTVAKAVAKKARRALQNGVNVTRYVKEERTVGVERNVGVGVIKRSCQIRH